MTPNPATTRACILASLERCNGNRRAASVDLGVSLRTLHRWVALYAAQEVKALTEQLAERGTLDEATMRGVGYRWASEDVRRAWRRADGDRERASRILGMGVRHALRLAKMHGIKVPRKT